MAGGIRHGVLVGVWVLGYSMALCGLNQRGGVTVLCSPTSRAGNRLSGLRWEGSNRKCSEERKDERRRPSTSRRPPSVPLSASQRCGLPAGSPRHLASLGLGEHRGGHHRGVWPAQLRPRGRRGGRRRQAAGRGRGGNADTWKGGVSSLVRCGSSCQVCVTYSEMNEGIKRPSGDRRHLWVLDGSVNSLRLFCFHKSTVTADWYSHSLRGALALSMEDVLLPAELMLWSWPAWSWLWEGFCAWLLGLLAGLEASMLLPMLLPSCSLLMCRTTAVALNACW